MIIIIICLIISFAFNISTDCVQYVNSFLVAYFLFLPRAMECKNNLFVVSKTNMLGLEYKVANYTKEPELEIQFTLTINKTIFLSTLFIITLQTFFTKIIKPMKCNVFRRINFDLHLRKNKILMCFGENKIPQMLF